MADDHYYPMQSSVKVGLKGICPRCGGGKLFKGYIDVAEKCPACGLDYSFVDAGDGPAVFIMMLAGFIVVGGALWMELSYQPPYWVQGVVWIPLGVILPLAILRPLKGWLIAQQYKHKAHEGQIG